MDPAADWVTHHGGCHCGAVRFTVAAPAHLDIDECNCSICRMSGFLHLIVTQQQFELLRGEGALRAYHFHTGTARHLFCEICGVKSFYVPRSHPAGYSVNARCLDPVTVTGMTIRPFDGQHWEEAIRELRERR